MAGKGLCREHIVHDKEEDFLFAKCSLTLSKEISSRRDDELLTAITSELKFKITGYADLTIEKEDVTEEDMSRLTKLLKSKLDPRLGDDYEIINSENDEVNHQGPESDGAEKSHQAVKKEGLESLESFEEISGPSDVTEESQSPEKIGNALKDSVAPQPANSQDEIDDLNPTFTRSLSLSESQTGDSSSRSTSQIMTGMDHQNLPANLEPTSSEEKRKYGSAPYQNMSSNQPVVSQPTGAASITSQKSDRPKRMMPHPPVDGKRDKQSKSGNQQKAENLSSTDTRGVRGIKDKDHEGNIGQMSSQEKEMPDGKIPQPSGHEDSNGGSGAENEGKVEDGQKNKINTAVLKEETAKNSKMQSNTTRSKKTKTSEKKLLEEGHGEAMDTSDVSDVDSLGSDTGDKGKCATPYNGNKDKQSDGSKRGNTDQVSAEEELEEGIRQVQGQSSITNQPDRMEQNRKSDLSQMTHEPVSSQDKTDDVGMAPNDTLSTRTKTRQRRTEVVPNQGNGFQGIPDGRNAAEEYTFDSHHTDQQMRKKEDLTKGERSTRQSESDNDENYEGKGQIRYDIQDKPRQSSERPGEPRMEAEKEEEYKESKQRGHGQAKHHSDDEHRMDTGEKKPFEPTILDNQANVNKSMDDEESYEEQGRNSEDMNQIRESEGQSGSVSDKDDEHKKNNSLFSQSTTERQRSIKEIRQPEKLRRNAKGKHQTGSAGKQSEDITDESDINTESTQRRQDNEVTVVEQKQLEKHKNNTGDVDQPERKGTIDNNTDESDTSERDETENKRNRQAEMNVSNEQLSDRSEKQLSLTGNMYPSGKTKGQRRDDAGENDKHNTPMSPCDDSRFDSQSGQNEVRGSKDHRRRKEKEDTHPVTNDQQGRNEHSDKEEGRRRIRDMQKGGRFETQQKSRMSPTFISRRGFDERPGDVYSDDSDKDGNKASESDNQSSASNDSSETKSRKIRQDSQNSIGSSEEEPTQRGFNDNKNLYAEARSQMEEVAREYSSEEQTCSHSDFAGVLPKGETTARVKKNMNYPKADRQQTDGKVKGRNEYDETEDMSKVERKAREREEGDTRSHEKPRARKEHSDEKEIKRQDTLDSDQSESDEVETGIEYIMKKTHYRLAKQYFEGGLKEHYLNKAENTEEGYLFSLGSKDTNDIRFLKELRKLKFEIVGHAKDDTPKIKLIADQLKCKDLNVKVIEHGSKSYLVGPRETVVKVKQRIISKLQENEEAANSLDTPENSMRQRGQPGMREDTDSSSRPSDGGARPKDFDEVKDPNEKIPYESKFGGGYNRGSVHQDDYMKRYGRDTDPSIHTGRYSDIRVHVHKADITKLNVDCIVNAANTKLKHGGGVARVIATAAGGELHDACERFIKSGHTVEVTGVFVSPGGHLRAKRVLHAVGPKWDLYQDKKKCTDDLRRTVLRCLVEAMRLRFSSIALPSISAAIFKVPKELCARSYMEAVKSFDVIFGQDKDCTLKEIHFVDIDDIMVNHIQESFIRHWEEPCDSPMKRSDERFSQEYLSSKMPLPSKSGASSTLENLRKQTGQGHQTKGAGGFSAPQGRPSGAGPITLENESEYQIKGIRLCVSSKPALNFGIEPVITVGEEFDKLSGLDDYSVKSSRKPCDEYHSVKKAIEFRYLSKPNGKNLRLLCRLFPEPKTPEDMKSAVEKLGAAIRMSSVKGTVKQDVTSFVLTSSILYAEPMNKRKESSKPLSPKAVGDFARLAFEYLDKASQDTSELKCVVITASRDALPHLCKVFESRDGVTKVAPGSYSHSKQRGKSPAYRGARHRDSNTSSSSYDPQRYSRQSSSGSGDKTSQTQYRGRDNPTAHSSDFKSSEYEKFCSKPSTRTGPGSSVDPKEECRVCRDDSKKGVPVSCCGQLICYGCELKVDCCPFCKKFWRIRTGNQPDGRMYVTTIDDFCDGYEHSKTWKIEYSFEHGIQKDNHPHPGRMYYSTIRTAYIPATDDALFVLKMLKLAFMRRLTFTVGYSRTRNKDDVITWNDIHHKTSCHSGTHGYPDPKYLGSVYYELLNNGVTLDSMTEEEKKIISKFEYDIKTIGYSFKS